jgi:predicted Zn-dependent protease
MNLSHVLRYCIATVLACLGGLAGTAATAGPVRPAQPAPPQPLVTDQVRVGNAALFRSLVPIDMLEQQAAEQYGYLVEDAQRDKHLLHDKQAPLPQVRAIAAKLVPYALKWNERSRQWHWEVNVTRTRRINAFCLPGGKILLTTGIIERLRLNDNEIAMLLGHEIAHALREHARSRLGQREAEQLAAHTTSQLFGLPALGTRPLSIGTQLLTAGYGRDDETEADVIGTEIAARAGYDPRAAISLWIKLDKLNRAERQPFLQARPYDARRITDLKKHQRDMLALYAHAINKPLGQLPPYRGVGYAGLKPRRARMASDQTSRD